MVDVTRHSGNRALLGRLGWGSLYSRVRGLRGTSSPCTKSSKGLRYRRMAASCVARDAQSVRGYIVCKARSCLKGLMGPLTGLHAVTGRVPAARRPIRQQAGPCWTWLPPTRPWPSYHSQWLVRCHSTPILCPSHHAAACKRQAGPRHAALAEAVPCIGASRPRVQRNIRGCCFLSACAADAIAASPHGRQRRSHLRTACLPSKRQPWLPPAVLL